MGNGNSRGARKHKNGGRRGFPSGTFRATRYHKAGAPNPNGTRRNHKSRGSW